MIPIRLAYECGIQPVLCHLFKFLERPLDSIDHECLGLVFVDSAANCSGWVRHFLDVTDKTCSQLLQEELPLLAVYSSLPTDIPRGKGVLAS